MPQLHAIAVHSLFTIDSKAGRYSLRFSTNDGKVTAIIAGAQSPCDTWKAASEGPVWPFA